MALVYSPRTQLQLDILEERNLIENLILHLDNTTMNHIHSSLTKETTLNNFLTLMDKHTAWWRPTLPNRPQLVNKFFTDIFFNATHHMAETITWQQFTKYIIHKMTCLKSIKAEIGEIPFLSPATRLSHTNIHKAIYLPFAKAVCFFSESSNVVHCFDPNTHRSMYKPLIVGKKMESKKGLHIKEFPATNTCILLDMILIQVQTMNVLLTSTNDRKVRGWVMGPNSFVQAYYPDNKFDPILQRFTSEVYTLSWDFANEIVYGGFKNGDVCIWKISLNVVKYIHSDHNSMIMCMVSLPRLCMVATGSLDGRVTLWDTTQQQKKWIYKHHSRGVLAIVYSESEYQLYSAGFDHQICIWNPYVSQLVQKIECHQDPILSLLLIRGNLVSIDQTGTIKVTSTKKYNTVVIHATNIRETNGMLYLPNEQKLCIYGETMDTVNYSVNHNPKLTDNSPLMGCFVKSAYEVVTISQNRLKLWSLLTGNILKVFVTALDNITSFCLLDDGVLLGDVKGNIAFVRINDELDSKPLPPHTSEVTVMRVLPNHKEDPLHILTASTSLHIISYDRQNFSTLKTVQLFNAMITCLEYHPLTRSILAATNTGNLLIYTEMLFLREQLSLSSSIIQSLIFLNQNTLAAAVDERLCLMDVGHNVMDNKVARVMELGSRITAMEICNKLLFLGSEKGMVICYTVEGKSVEESYRMRTGNEEVVGISCVEEQGLVVTVGADKMAKIWEMEGGRLVDHLKQSPRSNVNKATRNKKDNISFGKLLHEIVSEGEISAEPCGQEEMIRNPGWNLHIDLSKCQSKINNNPTELQEQQITVKLSESRKRIFDRSSPLVKERSSSTFSPGHFLKALGENRNISDQALKKIEVEAKRSVNNELKRIYKCQSFKICPKDSAIGTPTATHKKTSIGIHKEARKITDENTAPSLTPSIYQSNLLQSTMSSRASSILFRTRLISQQTKPTKNRPSRQLLPKLEDIFNH